jgi:hypothetical protein
LIEYTDALCEGALLPQAIEPHLVDESRPLLETVRFLYDVLQKASVPEELARRLEDRLASEWEKIPQGPTLIPRSLRQAFEQLISRALGDEGFRTQLVEDPEKAATALGLTLTPYELAALRTLDSDKLAALIEDLDERVSKTGIAGADLSALADFFDG